MPARISAFIVYDQFERKVIQIGTGYETLDYRSPEVGRDQLELLQVYRENGLREYYEDMRLDDAALQQGGRSPSPSIPTPTPPLASGEGALRISRRGPLIRHPSLQLQFVMMID